MTNETPGAGQGPPAPAAPPVTEADLVLIRPDPGRSGSGAAGGAAEGGAAGPLGLAAEVLKALAEGARALAGQLRDPAVQPAADALRKAGEGLDRTAEQLRGQDVDELLARGQGYVRDNPAVALGAAAVAGFLLFRMLRR